MVPWCHSGAIRSKRPNSARPRPRSPRPKTPKTQEAEAQEAWGGPELEALAIAAPRDLADTLTLHAPVAKTVQFFQALLRVYLHQCVDKGSISYQFNSIVV